MARDSENYDRSTNITYRRDATHLRHNNNLRPVDPKFKMTGKTDSLLDADDLEEFRSFYWINDNWVSIKESVFCWILSGPVQKPEL